ncbi:hypothetical protein BaRGS_00021451 [Batillaria attramentaria]|uniref:Uncharacterized protein n=1 Tax=Batillaria attramentaria TaxID=370345 RepID=A0ABD0KK69_9CAEN
MSCWGIGSRATGFLTDFSTFHSRKAVGLLASDLRVLTQNAAVFSTFRSPVEETCSYAERLLSGRQILSDCIPWALLQDKLSPLQRGATTSGLDILCLRVVCSPQF